MLAREAACRFAAKGERVLILCFTNPLAAWLNGTITSPGVRISSVGKLALDFMQSVNPRVTEPKDKPGWDQLLLEVTVDVMPKINRDWQTVIVDEAQDFSEAEWDFVNEISRGKRMWVFHDSGQHFWTERKLPAWLSEFANFELPENHRCAPGIMALANCYKEPDEFAKGSVVIDEALANGTIDIVESPSETAIPDKIANEISKLRSAGLRPSDIAILSLTGQTRARTFGLQRIGAYRIVKADDPDAESQIVNDTFLRFKGLERPAVIVTDLNLVHERREVRMYITITRAVSAIRFVATREAILADPILAQLAV